MATTYLDTAHRDSYRAVPAIRPHTLTAWRLALGLNALVVALGLAVKFGEAATSTGTSPAAVIGGLTSELCYFTIQSNIIVLIVSAALAWKPARSSWLAGAPRLAGLVCITITSVVYYSLLAGDEQFTGIARVGDLLAHLVSPLLFVGTWLIAGPRGQLHRHHVAQMLTFPAVWISLILVRGAVFHVYPYDFVDVDANGYVAVLVTIAALSAAAAALAVAALRIDRRLTARYSMVP